MDDQAALHADIFGESDEEDDEYVPPTHAADGEDDDLDERANAILETHNNLLLVGKKEKKEKKERKKKEKKEKKEKEVGRGGKRKSKPSADAMAAEGAKQARKRLKKSGEGEAGASGEGGGEGGGEEGAAGAEGDDPDEDSIDGDEAIEAGGKGDFDRIMQGLKHKRGGPIFSREKLTNDVKDLQERMEQAVEDDDKAAAEEPPRPAIAKVAMLPEVEALLRKKQYHETMIDHSMLSTLAHWLRPMADGSLVSLMVRKGILAALLRFEIDETTLGSLRSSGIGKYVKLLTLHKRETQEVRDKGISLACAPSHRSLRALR